MVDTTPGRGDPFRLLVLGGTRFVGRALVDAALAEGHRVTLFNQGQTAPGLFAGRVEERHGDRTKSLGPLAGGVWDAVVDVAGYHPAVISRSLDALGGEVGRYLFVSTVSVYADQTVPPVEGAPTLCLDDPDDDNPASYGARKAACEELLFGQLGERATVVRPGLIVGPHDPTDRFAYWPRRMATGGRVLAPGSPADPMQFIDVRNLAGFMLRLLEDDRAGTFNVTGPTMSFGALLGACQAVTGADAEVVWVPSDRLLAAGLDPWMGVPLWIGDPAWRSANRVDSHRALTAGLAIRPLEDTIRAVLDTPGSAPLSPFDRHTEVRLLAATDG